MIRRNSGVTYVAKAFRQANILKTTNIFTRERNHTNANIVRLALPVKEIKQCMRKDILVTKGINQRSTRARLEYCSLRKEILYQFFVCWILNDSDLLDHLRSIWYHSDPSDFRGPLFYLQESGRKHFLVFWKFLLNGAISTNINQCFCTNVSFCWVLGRKSKKY